MSDLVARVLVFVMLIYLYSSPRCLMLSVVDDKEAYRSHRRLTVTFLPLILVS